MEGAPVQFGQGRRGLPAQPLGPGVTRDADAAPVADGGDVAPADEAGDVLAADAELLAHLLRCQKFFHLSVSFLPLVAWGNFWYYYPVHKVTG